MHLSKRTGIGFPFALTGAALIICALISPVLNASLVPISLRANLGATTGVTLDGDTLQVTRDVTGSVATNTDNAGNTALFGVGLGKILQDARSSGKNGDLRIFNNGTGVQTWTARSPDNYTSSPGTWVGAAPVAHNDLAFAENLGLTLNQVAALAVSSLSFNSGAGVFTLGGGADAAVFATDRVVTRGDNGATITWGAGTDTLSSGSITGTMTASTSAIQSDTGIPILAGPGSTMPKTTGGTYAVTAIKTWNGGSGTDSNWSRSNNWGGTGAPVAGDSLFFGGSTRLSNTNDLTADTSFAGITFNSGAGAFTLGGNSITLGGNVTNSSTALQTISLDMILSANRTFTTSTGGGDLIISGVLSETGGVRGITKIGAGTLTLSGAASNTFTGATIVNQGTLVLNKASGPGNAVSGTLTIGDGIGGVDADIVLQLQGNQIEGSVTINSSGKWDLNNQAEVLGGTLTMTAGNITTGATGLLTLNGDVTGIADALSATISGNLSLGGANRTFTIADGAVAVDMQISAVISGTAAEGMIKAGTGTLVLSSANTYTGATTINAGVLNIQNNTGLGTTAGGTTVSNGATLQFQGGITVGSEALNIRGTGAGGQTGALVNVSGTNNYGGLLTLAGATTLSSNTGTLNLTNTNTITGATFGLTLTGAGNGSISSIIGTTSGSLTKSGTGSWTLSGVNTFTGATTVNGGTLTLASGPGGALGFTSGITVNSGATLFLGASNQINNIATITLGGGTFAKGNFSEGSAGTAGAGALVLSAAGSHLDFGTGAVGVFTFASFAPGANTLTIDNWTGTSNTVGTAFTDRLIFASDQSGNLGSFNFTGFGSGAVEFDLGNGYWEITPVPEAGTYFSGSIVLALILLHHRRQLRLLVHRWRASRRLRFSVAHGTGVAS